MDYKELEKYIKQLFNKYLKKYKMTIEDRQDVIQDSMIQIFRKVQDGTLVGDVETNKNYIFIVTRNRVLQKVYPTKNEIDYTDYVPDIHISPATAENDLNNTILSEQIKEALKSKRFSEDERYIITKILEGYEFNEAKRELGHHYNYHTLGYSNTKSKIKDILFPTFKYIVEYENKKVGFKNKKHVAKHLNMSPEQFNNYMDLGKTIFPNYKIVILS
jgi:DNA-directed RNA polymerase specialized sigma24 family protein